MKVCTSEYCSTQTEIILFTPWFNQCAYSWPEKASEYKSSLGCALKPSTFSLIGDTSAESCHRSSKVPIYMGHSKLMMICN